MLEPTTNGPGAGSSAIAATLSRLWGEIDVKSSLRFAAAAVATLLLLAPAIWNGFPFLEYDSGGYLARWFEGYLVPSRSTVYGLFAVGGWPLHFWPEMLLQAAAAVWIISL